MTEFTEVTELSKRTEHKFTSLRLNLMLKAIENFGSKAFMYAPAGTYVDEQDPEDLAEGFLQFPDPQTELELLYDDIAELRGVVFSDPKRQLLQSKILIAFEASALS